MSPPLLRLRLSNYKHSLQKDKFLFTVTVGAAFCFDFPTPSRYDGPMKRIHVIIAGNVQGVFYRASMQREAKALGVTGWVRNLPDGRVEAIIEGNDSQLSALTEWCRQGPSRAIVEKVELREEPYQGEFHDFTIRF